MQQYQRDSWLSRLSPRHCHTPQVPQIANAADLPLFPSRFTVTHCQIGACDRCPLPPVSPSRGYFGVNRRSSPSSRRPSPHRPLTDWGTGGLGDWETDGSSGCPWPRRGGSIVHGRYGVALPGSATSVYHCVPALPCPHRPTKVEFRPGPRFTRQNVPTPDITSTCAHTPRATSR
jgi:hypothetical protein